MRDRQRPHSLVDLMTWRSGTYSLLLKQMVACGGTASRNRLQDAVGPSVSVPKALAKMRPYMRPYGFNIVMFQRGRGGRAMYHIVWGEE